jgi:hypothetical protein
MENAKAKIMIIDDDPDFRDAITPYFIQPCTKS